MYLVITMYVSRDGQWIRERCPGYYRHIETAINRVLVNAGDMFERGYYNYALILKLDQGLYPQGEEVYWFKYGSEGDIDYCSRPEGLTRNLPVIIG